MLREDTIRKAPLSANPPPLVAKSLVASGYLLLTATAGPRAGGKIKSAMAVATSRYWAIRGGERISPSPTLSKPSFKSSAGKASGSTKSGKSNRSRTVFSYSSRLSLRGTSPPIRACCVSCCSSQATTDSRSAEEGCLAPVGGINSVANAPCTRSQSAVAPGVHWIAAMSSLTSA